MIKPSVLAAISCFGLLAVPLHLFGERGERPDRDFNRTSRGAARESSKETQPRENTREVAQREFAPVAKAPAPAPVAKAPAVEKAAPVLVDSKIKDNIAVQKAEQKVAKENRTGEILTNIGESLKSKPGDQGRTVVEKAVKEFGPQGTVEAEANKRADARRTGQLIIEQSKQPK